MPAEAALKFLPASTLTPRGMAILRATADRRPPTADRRPPAADRESQARNRLRHVNVVTTYEVLGVDDPSQPAVDGSTVVVMERASENLQTRLDRNASRPVPNGARLIRAVLDAL